MSALGDVTWELAKRLRTPEEVATGTVWGGYISEAQEWITRILTALDTGRDDDKNMA